MARKRPLPSGFRRASGGVSASADAARRRRVRKEKERIEREARLAKLRTDRQAKAWAAPRSVFIPPALRKKPKPKKTRPRTFAEDTALGAMYTRDKKGKLTGKRRLATKSQRRKLQSAQSAKRQRLAKLAVSRPARVDVEKQPRTIIRRPGFKEFLDEAERKAQKNKDVEEIARLRKLRSSMGLDDPGAIRGFLGRAGREAEAIAEGTPGFVVHTAADAAQDIADIARHPLDPHAGERTVEHLIKPTAKYYKERYADPIIEGEPQRIAEEFLEKPVSGALDVFGAASLAGRGASISRALKAGKSLPQAVMESRYPAQPRQITTALPTGKPKTVQLRSSPNPVKRAVDRAYDRWSMSKPERRQVGSQARVVREMRRQSEREHVRAVAKAHNLSRSVKKVRKGPKADQDAIRARFYWLAQLPPEMRNNKGLQLVQRYLADELAQVGVGSKARGRSQAKTIGELRAKIAQLTADLNKHAPDTKIYATKERQLASRQVELARAEGKAGRAGQELEKAIYEIERAMELGELPEEAAAFKAAADITAESERLLRETLGDDYADNIIQRRGLLARAITGDETAMSDIFVHHADAVENVRNVMRRPQARIGSVRAPSYLRGKNKLARVREGATIRDPAVIIDDLQRKQALSHLNQQRRALWDMAEEIPAGGGPRPGHTVIVDPDAATANPDWWARFSEGTDDVFQKALQDYVKSWIGVNGENPQIMLGGVAEPRLRQIPDNLVNTYFGPNVDAKAGPFAIVNSLVKTSLLYLNPGYIPANLVGNLVFLGLQQPVMAIPNLYRAGKVFWSDRELATILSAEYGRGPTKGVATPMDLRSGGKYRGQVLKGERWLADVIGDIPDEWPRMAAGIYELKRARVLPPRIGALNKADKAKLKRFFESTDPKDVALKNDIEGRVNEAMVNFSRIGPTERQTLARVFFVWPWIRGASAWTYKFATDSPEKAAIVAQAATREQERNNKMLGELPSQFLGAVGLGVEGDVATILPTTSISPTATALETGQTIAGLFQGEAPSKQSIAEMVNPAYKQMMDVAAGENQFGENVGYARAAYDMFQQDFPLARLGNELAGDVSPIYADNDWLSVLKRRVLRVAPVRIKLSEAHASARRQRGEKAPAKVLSVGDENLTLAEWNRKATRFARARGGAWVQGLPNIKRLARLRAQEHQATAGLDGQEKTLEFIDVIGDNIPADTLPQLRAAVRRTPADRQDSYLQSLRSWFFGDLYRWNQIMAAS